LLILILLRISLTNYNLLLLLGSSFSMFAQFLLFLCNETYWLLLNLLLLYSFIRFSTSKVFAPSIFCYWRFLGGYIGVIFTACYKICMLLSLLIHQVFVLGLIYLLCTLLMSFRHFLSHDLRKYTVSTWYTP